MSAAGTGSTPRADGDGTVSRYLSAPPLEMAHRGGVALAANAGIENSLAALGNAVDLGFRYVETDARASVDGEAFAFHDTDLARVAPDSRFRDTPFAELTAEQIRSVRLAGGEPLPTIAEILEAFPTTRVNIDVKTVEAIEPTVRAVEAAGAVDRVMIAAFSHRRLSQVRRRLPRVATSASPWEVVALRFCPWLLTGFAKAGGAQCVQVPERQHGIRILTPGFIAATHRAGMQVHVWTIDDPDEIDRLLDAGVDGIFTDRPDVLREVLQRRGQWHAA